MQEAIGTVPILFKQFTIHKCENMRQMTIELIKQPRKRKTSLYIVRKLTFSLEMLNNP